MENFEKQHELSNPILEKLKEEGVDIEYQKKFFYIMKKIDLPLINKLASLWMVFDKEGLGEVKKGWKYIRDKYNDIDIGELNGETGKLIIENLKPLIVEFDEELNRFYQSIDEKKDIPSIPKNLDILREKISKLATEFGDLIPYRVYRALTEKRGFQE